MSTAHTSQVTQPADHADRWSAFFTSLLPRAAMVGPGLMVIAALCVSFGLARLPGDLDWISEPEAFFGMLAVPFLFATWTVVGRTVADGAPRTGIAITLIGALAAAGYAFPMAIRSFSADLVLNDVAATAINDTWESDEASIFSLLIFVLMTAMLFVVAIVAGIAVLKTRVAPIWAGVAFVLFPPVFMTAQAAYVAIEVTYPLACALLLAAVVGTVHSSRSSQPDAAVDVHDPLRS